MLPRFEWDTAKAASNFTKHGVAFEEARTAFADPFASITDEPRHSVGELREVLMGLSDRGRLIVVMFTERDEAVRIISARQATRNERRNYEEAHP